MRPKDTIPINQYFGSSIGNGQDPDEPGNQRSGPAMEKIAGKGSQGGGSRMTPQTKRMTTGSGSRSSRITIPTSRPSGTQKIRG